MSEKRERKREREETLLFVCLFATERIRNWFFFVLIFSFLFNLISYQHSTNTFIWSNDAEFDDTAFCVPFRIEAY